MKKLTFFSAVFCGIAAFGEVLEIKGGDAKDAFSYICERAGETGDLVLTQESGRFGVDSRPAFAKGMLKLVMNAFGGEANFLGGETAAFDVVLEGNRGDQAVLYFEGQTAEGHHWFRSVETPLAGMARRFGKTAQIPAGIRGLHLRIDIVKATGPVWIHRARMGRFADLYPAPPPRGAPGLTFALPLDGDAKPTLATGDAKPVSAENLRFVRARRGRALAMTAGSKSSLEFRTKGNVDAERGTLAFWFKCTATNSAWRGIFGVRERMGGHEYDGTGALNLWNYDMALRADIGDLDDSYRCVPGFRALTDWQFVVWTWDHSGSKLFLDGRLRAGGYGRDLSPQRRALTMPPPPTYDRKSYDVFAVGSWLNGFAPADGLLSDLKIWDGALSGDDVRELFRKEGGVPPPQPAKPDYTKTLRLDGANPHELPPQARAGVPGRMNLLETVALDAAGVARLKADERFVSSGPLTRKTLGGRTYLEAGARSGDRYAVRFRLDPKIPLHCFEIDYPDDAKRTIDLVVQYCSQTEWDGTSGADYTMQVGVAAGDEYPNTGRMLTHRCLYWTKGDDVALLVMSARDGAPAAVGEIRLYAVEGAALPRAEVREPPAPSDGWRRVFGLYYEDPAIEYNFSKRFVPDSELNGLIDRAAAYMKYCGQNMLLYPGAWYSGIIGGKDGPWLYNPRQHPVDFLSAWYEKFDREGLFFVPTINQNQKDFDDDRVTPGTMTDGSLHPTEIAIFDTGCPNPGGWHDTPPAYNFFHPSVRQTLEEEIDLLVEQGLKHPSFKGVCMHLTRHSLGWWGDLQSGYNDYAVEAFARDTGIQVPGDRADPLRGAAYAAFLKEEAYGKWVQWRCDQVTAFYTRMATKMKTRRPDLKLWLNSFVPADVHHPDFAKPDFVHQANRECGLDGPELTAGAPNIVLCQTMVPADYRYRRPNAFPSAAARDHQQTLDETPGFYSLLDGAKWPWVNQHDRYWEDPLGQIARETGERQLACGWLKECPWRVTTINPSGRNALRHFVEPLRYHDVLGMSKGGFLVGTYGMEDELAPFAQAFRALPAVVMSEVARRGNVVMRQADFKERSWFYIVNAGGTPADIRLRVPPGTRNLVDGGLVEGDVRLSLLPWDIRSYSAPSGSPAWTAEE